jgi:endo-1,4-beta-xylanase
VAASSATTTLSFSSLPSGAAVGDILMVHVSAVLGSSDITCTTSNLTRSVITNDSTTLRSAVFWRTLTSGDISSPPTMSFSGPSATGMHLNAMCVVGADPTTPVANTASGASSGTRARDITIGGNTGEAAGELVLALIGSNSSPVPWATNNIVGAPLAMITSEQVPGGMVDSTSQARVETAIGFKTPIGHSWYQWDMSAYTFPEAGGSGTGVTSDYENNRLSSISWPSEQTWPGGQNATVVSPNAPSGDTSPSYWLQYLAQGNYDALIYAFMAKLRTWGRAVVFRPFCEMNGGDHPWEVAWETHVHRATDAEHATYLKLAWQRVFLIAKGTDAELASAGMLSAGGFTTSSLAYTQNSGHSADAQNVFFHWNPQAFETSTTNRWDDYWPGTTPSGRAYVDFAGVELYISTGGTWSSTLNQLLHSTTVNSGRTHNSLYDHYIPLTNLNGGGSGETGYRYKSSEASTAAAIARINSIFDGTNGLAFNPLWRFLGYWDGGLETGTNGDSHVDNTGHSDIRTAITTILATGYLRPVLTDTMLSAPSGWTLGKQARRSLDTGSTSAHTNGGPGEVGSIVLWASAPIASATASTVGYGNYTSLSLLVSPISVAGISDTISFTVRPTVPLVDTITITESIQLRTAYKIADTISISDSLARAQPRALADTISITDAIKRRITPLLTDIGAFPNLLLPGGTVLPGGGVVATDCDTLAVTVRRFLADTISVSDSLVRKPTRALIDTIAVSDSLVKYAAKLLADTIAVSDSLARRVTRPLADTIAISDALAKGTLLHLSETISVSDTLASLRVRPITDTISITENLATSASGHKSVTLSDTISVSDALALRTTRLFADSISITDNLTAVAGHRQVALADTIAVSDLLARKGAPQLTDTIAVGTDQTLGADTFSRTVPVGLGIADSGQSYGTFGSGISVGSGVASIPFAANTGIGGYMVGPNSKNTGALMKMGFTALPDDIASSFLLLRLDSGFTHYYNAHLYLTPGGQVVLSRTIFTPSGSFDAGTSDITIDASWVNTQAYWLRFEALGTTLRWKAWKDGSSEPHAWSFVTVDGSVSASGTVGFQTFANAGLTASVQGTFDQLSFYSPGDWITTALPSRHLPLVDTISISDRLQHHVLGTSITAAQTTDPHYAPIVLRSFQSVTPEYEMQWGQVEPSQGTFFWTNVDTITAWAVANRKQVRGHTLIWDGGGDPAMMPPWVTGGSWTSTTLKAALQAHINAVVGRYKGVVRVWHVVNEAFEDDGSRTNWIFQNVIGDSWIELAFQYAYAADPTAKLLYNDYGDDWGYYSLNPKYNAILAMATDFVNRGIPIHGIGFQGHYDLQYTDYPDPADLTGVLSTYAALGLEVHLTELDCRIDNVADPMATRLTNQATVYRNARNGLVGAQGDYINIWGISDATNWLGPTAASAPLDTRYIEKPAWRQINDFVEPATFYPGLTDTISVSDALTTKRTHALADAISISDALSVRHPRTLADSISVTDSLRRTPGPRLADTIVISDSLRAQVGKRNLADAISVSDALNVGPARRLNDSLSVTDSLKSLRIRRLDDTIAISDRIKGQQILHDGFQVSDLLTFVGTFLELQAFFTLRDFAAVRFLTADFAAVGFTSITRRFARSTTAEKLVGFTSRDFRATDTVLTEEPDTV